MAVAGVDDEATPLFPALSPAQRYHFEVYGYVIVPQLLTESETSSLLAELHALLSAATLGLVGNRTRHNSQSGKATAPWAM